MVPFAPVPFRSLGQRLPEATPILPDPDLTFVGFTGLPGVVETLTVLTVTAAAAWTGIHAATTRKDPYLKAVGWVGGIGSGLAGLLYLAAKSGVGQSLGIPAIRVSPA